MVKSLLVESLRLPTGETVVLDGSNLTIGQLWAISQRSVRVELAPAAREKMKVSRKYIVDRIAKGDVIYGVNTGFGPLCTVRISDSEIDQMQLNFVRSHSSGVGEAFAIQESRAMLALRANALATGHSGIRPEVVDFILNCLNQNLVPVIPQQGSVGASGDLAPLAHMALAFIGEGEMWAESSQASESSQVFRGQWYQAQSAKIVLDKAGLAPLKLQMKEALSLTNGCQVMTGVGALNAYRSAQLLKQFDIAGAMSLEALQGGRGPFDPLVPATRRHRGEALTARNLLKILGGTSEISRSHEGCGRVQDVYSLRCMPAVQGASKETLRRTIETLEIEANSSTDNPLVFPEENKILSCGNFHGEPVAFVLDFLAVAMAEAANISSCRIEKLTNTSMSGLPPFLAKNPGLQSCLMIVQYASAALVSENKVLCHPASADSIPTSANKEDHVSMGTIAARKLTTILNNVEQVLAMEYLTAAQGLDHVLPLKPAAGVAIAFDCIRKKVPFAAEDRIFANDIKILASMVKEGVILAAVENAVGALEV
jgi:histidine ammonia-lyase